MKLFEAVSSKLQQKHTLTQSCNLKALALLHLALTCLPALSTYQTAEAATSSKPSQPVAVETKDSKSSESPAQSDLVQFERFETGGTLIYQLKSKSKTQTASLKTNFVDTKYLSTLKSKDGGLPYFLFLAKPCQDCQDEQAVYMLRPNGEKATAFVYPGKILDPKTRAVLLDSRAFYGKCLPNRGDVYVVFQKERVDRRHSLQASVMTAEPARDHLRETLTERRLPNIKTTLQLVKRKTCSEIEGRNRLMLRKPLDLHPRDNGDKDDEEDDDENQSKKDDGEKDPHLSP
jgi:hypothetical protein